MSSTTVSSISTYDTSLLTERVGEVYCSLTYEKFFINCLRCSEEFNLLSCNLFIKHIKECLPAVPHDLARENLGSQEAQCVKECAPKDDVETADYTFISIDPLMTIKEEGVKEKEEVNEADIYEDVECLSDYQNEDDLPLDKLGRRKIVEGIINEYKKHPVLWDTKITAKRTDKIRAYRKIRKAVNLKYKTNFSYIELRNQIQNLRSGYRRVLRRMKVFKDLFPDGTKQFNPMLWFFDKMSFIEATNQDYLVDLTLNSETDGEGGDANGNKSSDSLSDSTAHDSKKTKRIRPITKMLNEREIISNIISQYKQYPFLWDQTSPLYSDRHARKDAFRKITKFINQKFHKNVTDNELRQQIINLRGVYRRVQRGLHKPNYQVQLWYYDELSFIDNKASFAEHATDVLDESIKQKTDFETIPHNPDTTDFINCEDNREISMEESSNEDEDDNKEQSNLLSCRKKNNKVILTLIEEYRKHPCLWSKNHNKTTDGLKWYDALKEIVSAVNAKHKTFFTKAEIRNKLVQLRSSYRRVLRSKEAFEKKHANAKRKFFPHLWYFDKIMFIGARDSDFLVSRKKKTNSESEGEDDISGDQRKWNAIESSSVLCNLEDKNNDLLTVVIEEYRMRPCLWKGKCDTATRRKYLNEICNEVNQRFNVKFNYRNLDKEINALISLYKRIPLGRSRRESEAFKSKPWFSDLLSFIDSHDSDTNERSDKLEKHMDCATEESPKIEHNSSGDEEASQSPSPVNNKEIVFRIIELFKDAAILWDTNHPQYTLRTERKKSIESIIAKLSQEHDCHLTVEEFRYHIRFLKMSYFRAVRQEIAVKQANLDTNYAFKPFFFDEMSFLEPYADKKPFTGSDPQVTSEQQTENFKFLCENKQLMLNFIGLYKAHACLWDQSHEDRNRPSVHAAAYSDIIKMFNESGEVFTHQRLQSAIGFLHATVANTQKALASVKTAKESPVWFYEHLQFLGEIPRINEKFCTHCNQHFHSLAEYEKHKIEIAGDYPYKCDVCNAGFVSRSKFAYHQITHKEPHKCDQCDFQAFDKHNFNVHMRRHKGIHLFRCDECDKGFVTSSELNRHLRMHTGEKAYICEVCGKALVASAEYHEHMKRHRNQRDHKCEICDSAFFTAKTLKGHMASHSSERQHICDICGSAFKRKKTLCQHMALHMEKKKHECTICGKLFAQKAGVYSHMKSHGQVIGS